MNTPTPGRETTRYLMVYLCTDWHGARRAFAAATPRQRLQWERAAWLNPVPSHLVSQVKRATALVNMSYGYNHAHNH